MLIGVLYLFNFASDPQRNSNSTFFITGITNASQSDTVGFKGKKLTIKRNFSKFIRY